MSSGVGGNRQPRLSKILRNEHKVLKLQIAIVLSATSEKNTFPRPGRNYTDSQLETFFSLMQCGGN